jgi:hypothetical protein
LRGTAIRIVIGASLVTALLLALAVAVPEQRAHFIGIYLLVLAAFVATALVRSFRTLRPRAWERSVFDRRPEEPEQALPIDELARIDRLVVLGGANAFDLHYRLRPLLRDLAADRLSAGHGVSLDGQPERAQRLLGEELWELVRADREVGRRSGPGVAPGVLAGFVERLEEL